MQSQDPTYSAMNLGHRRRPSMGKAMPVTDLLLNFPPPSMASMRLSHASDTQPPRYFNLEELDKEASFDVTALEVDEAMPEDVNAESDFEVLVSDCSSDGSGDVSEQFALIGSADAYTPCLSCTGAASAELLMRPIAINEMCRKLCTDDCRLRLSLAGYEPPSEAALRSKEALGEFLKQSYETQHCAQHTAQSLNSKQLNVMPSKIELQRQKFLNEILKEPSVEPATKNMGNARGNVCDRSEKIVDTRDDNMLKDFREKVEIAEALARTSAMTSTSQIKQRLAARKLEIELENPLAVSEDERCVHQGAPVASAANDDAYRVKNADVLAAMLNGSDYEPPREVLLYLVRMGSFNSAPKIHNTDSQDDGLEIPKGLSTNELLQHVRHLRGETQPPLLTRYFLKPLDTQMVSHDITDGLRYLKLGSTPKVGSATISAPNHMRLLQWNILSQTLGQNNDNFVSCPDEALTWENRKYLIVQEILQTSPDIICLQEVDHFKFLQKILGTQNYDGIFFPKPDSPCLYVEENNGPDGCAIFYKRDKLELKNFDTRILEVWRVQSNQVAIAANFKLKATGQELCVCTTHLKARHGALLSKLRNEQGRDLIRFVKQFAEERPLLLCGDFNAEPVEPVYSTILNCDILDLSSAYADIRALKENAEKKIEDEDKVMASIKREPPYTTWKIREDGEVCHTIDYVFYTKENLKVKNCLEFPIDEEIGKNRTPSFQYPSDHFSLVCDFEIVQ